MNIIDAHVHLFNPVARPDLPWPPVGSPLRRPSMPKDLRDAASGFSLGGAVAIEASPRLADTEDLLRLADSDPFLLGVVGNLRPDLDGFAARLEAASSRFRFLGVRLRPIESFNLRSPALIRNLAMLAAAGKSLELGAPQIEQLEALPTLLTRLPDIRFILDHAGHPSINSDKVDDRWLKAIRAVARFPGSYCKISNLVRPVGAVRKSPDLAFYQSHLDALWQGFGPERVIFGSNWPVCIEHGGYATQIQLLQDFLEGRDQDAGLFFSANACSAYRLKVSGSESSAG
ncbi:MAG TPA: amidohydrolase family protein [Xanthomonadales bacterium]|nr:amidohydrolase family protein [Xanthomonadales bacterium]